MTQQVEFYFDYGSPASYLAWTQLPGLTARTGAVIVHRPMLLGGVFKATGNSSPISVPAKGAYMGRDLERCARHMGVTFRSNDAFPINTLGLMRGAVAAQRDEILEPYSAAVFEAIWTQNRDMGQPETIVAVLEAAGLDARGLMERTADPAIKDELKANTEQAVSRGVFGAPTFFVGGEMFWGQDRLDHLERALREGATG